MNAATSPSTWDRIPLAVKALLVLVFPLMALLFVAASPARSVENDAQSKLTAVAHLETVDKELRGLRRGLLEAETATYAFVMTGADDTLEPFRRAQEASPASLAKLESAIASKPELDHLHRAANLSDVAFNTLADLRQYSALPGVATSEVPADLARKSRAAVQSALDEFAAIDQAERAELGKAIRSQGPAQASGSGVTGAGAITLGLFGGLAALALVVWDIRRRERRVHEGCAAEVDRLHKEQANGQARAWSDAAQARAAEQNHRRQVTLYRSALDGLNDAVVIADDRGRYVYYNPAAEKILGRGLAFQEPSQWPARYALRKADGATPYAPEEVPFTRALKGESIEAEDMRLLSRDAPQPIWTRATARPLKDASGIQFGGLLILRDVTTEKMGPKVAPPPPRERTSIRGALEDAVVRTEDEAEQYQVRLRATIGAAWQSPVFASREQVGDAIEFFLSAMIQQCPEGSAITLSATTPAIGSVRLEIRCANATPLDVQASGLQRGHDLMKKIGGAVARPTDADSGAVVWLEWPMAIESPGEMADGLENLHAAVAPEVRIAKPEASGSTMEVVRSS